MLGKQLRGRLEARAARGRMPLIVSFPGKGFCSQETVALPPAHPQPLITMSDYRALQACPLAAASKVAGFKFQSVKLSSVPQTHLQEIVEI